VIRFFSGTGIASSFLGVASKEEIIYIYIRNSVKLFGSSQRNLRTSVPYDLLIKNPQKGAS
jgi:hypothetical protein